MKKKRNGPGKPLIGEAPLIPRTVGFDPKDLRRIERQARRRKQSVSRRVRELLAAGLAAEGER